MARSIWSVRMQDKRYLRSVVSSVFGAKLTSTKSKDNHVEIEVQTRILHILSDKDKRLRPLENLVSSLDSTVFSQVICCLRGDKDKETEFEAFGQDVIGLSISATTSRGFQPSLVFKIARIIRERKIDIVHCQRHKPTVYGTLAAYLTGKNVKVISHVRGLNRTRNLRRRLLNRVLFRRITSIIAVSNGVREDIVMSNSAAVREKVVTVYNGINVELFVDCKLTRRQARRAWGECSELGHWPLATGCWASARWRSRVIGGGGARAGATTRTASPSRRRGGRAQRGWHGAGSAGGGSRRGTWLCR